MLANGTLLQNRYLIKYPLAQGGMGTVYEAEAIHLGHAPVAVKETFFAQDWLREQFQREASMLARLRHDALPRVSDHFVEGAGQFLVMEFIPGQDLDDILREKLKSEDSPFEWRLVMKWADRLLDALEYIHQQHPPIIHRDIKPSNLKLTPRGDLFLIDFGLAKDATTPTKPGRSVHAYTLNYAPLEQLKGTGTDARSDLYSLGATLYHLLTGEMPENAKVREEVIRYGVPDPLQLVHKINPQAPEPLAQVLARSMMLDRAERYQSATEMREALRQAQPTIEESLTSPGRQQTEPRQPKGKERRRQGEVITRELQKPERRLQEEEERRYLEEARQRQLEEERRRQEESAERQRQEAERRKVEEENRLREKEERLLAEQRRQEEEKRQEETRQRELAEKRKREEEKQRQEEQRIAEQKRLEQELAEQRKLEEEKRRQEEQRIAEQKRLEQELAEQQKREEEKRRQEEQRIAEQKRLEQELAEQQKREEEKRRQEEQRIAEQKRLEKEQADKRRQEEETHRQELTQREFERKRKREIERRTRPGQVTKVQSTRTTPKFKPSGKPPGIEKAPETPAIESPVIETVPDAAITTPLPGPDRKDWMVALRSPRARLAAGAAVVFAVLLVYLLWPQRKNDIALQPKSQTQPLIVPKIEVVEKLQYWFELKDQPIPVTSHELAPAQEFKLHFKSREDGYLYLLAMGENDQLTVLSDGPIKSGSDFPYPARGQGRIQGLGNGEQLRVTVLLARNQIGNLNGLLGMARGAKSQTEAIEMLKVLVGAIMPESTEDLGGRGTPAVAVRVNADDKPLIFDMVLTFKSN